VAHALAHQRAHLDHRAAVVGADRTELLAGLTALVAGESPDELVRGIAAPGRGKIAFLFPGQGSQYAGMARELAEHHPVFAERLRECVAALDPHLDYSVADVLAGAPDAPGYDRVDVVQPVLFAVMVSLAELWRAHGVTPDVVVGHSQGEIAAACVSGGLSLPDAARVVALRSRALSEVTGAGGMVSVSLPMAELAPRLTQWADRLSVAAVNGPSTVVVSGERVALAELLAECAAEGVWAREIPVDYASHSTYMSVLEAPLAAALAPIEPRAGDIRFHSTLTGEPIDTTGLDAGYWYRNIRETVRFEPVVRQLVEQGYRAFVEMSPHPILTVAIGQTLEAVGADPARVAVTGTLHRERADRTAFTTALAALHTRGVPVDWTGLVAGSPAMLPSYAFQSQRFWVEPPVVDVEAGDVSAAGLVPVDHPLLNSAVRPAGGAGWLFTGRLSQRTHPWLADHAVSGVVLLPGAAFVELATYVGGLLGAGVVEELTIEAPFVVPESGAVAIQVAVGEPDGEGLRSITIHSHEAADQVEDVEFTCHATGVLAVADAETSPELDVATWPTEGAEIPVDDLYDRLAGQGFEYGPAFQGLRASWRGGDEVIAEVRLDAAHQAQASRFGVHPALLDAAFHAVVVRLGDKVGHASLPFSWSGVRIHRAGVSSLRVRLVPTGPDSVGLFAVTESGAPVLSVRSVLARPVTLEQLTAARRSRSNALFTVDWTATSVAAAVRPAGRVAVLGLPDLVPGAEHHESLASVANEPPDVLLALFDGGAGELAGVARATTQRALTLLQDFLADERLIDTRLVVVTTEAVALRDEQPNLGAAAVVGLVRTAQAEHPGRIVLVDVDDAPATRRILPAAIAAGEPQLAIRTGAVFVPRLAKVADDGAAPTTLAPHGTVLVTGGTGGIGAVVARHLVVAHGVSRLLLVSRRGPATDGVAELTTELTALGATVTVAACDVTDRAALAAVIAAVPAAHPLTAVIHSAAVLDDGLLESFTPERLTRVLRPKIDAALHLHELTMGHELAAFVLFSSVAGVFGGPGQGNYAAGNAFLDALAHARRAAGLPATSMAWGLWADASDLTRHLSAADVTRLARSGLAALSTEDGLSLFDAALRLPSPLVVAARLDTAAIRAKARAGDLAPMFRDLVRLPALPPSEAEETLADRLAELPEAEWDAVVLDIVLSQTAAVLGHPSPDSIDAERAFTELGFDSLTAVQLRNRLTAATGLALPSVLVFNHPTPAAIAKHLRSRLAKKQPGVAPDLVAQLDRLAIAIGSLGGPDREPLLARLRTVLAELAPSTADTGVSTGDQIRSASAEELFDLIDRGLGG
jgi:acyl transferase domain-containing protein/acyl carrier protein